MDICLFAGGNTATGFVSFYHQLCAHARYTTILKGGPGSGKSSLMKKIAAAAEEKQFLILNKDTKKYYIYILIVSMSFLVN